MSIPYTPKVGQRGAGQELLISSESHTIGFIGVLPTTLAHKIKLVEVPLLEDPSSVVIPTYTEVLTTPGISEFVVDYATGIIAFNPSDSGSVTVNYKGRGSIDHSVDINEIQEPVGTALNVDGSLTNGIVTPLTISGGATDDFTFPRDVTVTRSLIVDSTSTLTDSVTLSYTTPSTVPYIDPSNILVSSSVTPTELGYVSGVSSAIQTQLNAKKTIATGNNYKFETTDATGNLQETSVTPNRAVATDSNGLPTASATTDTELGYVSGVTSAIQTQLDGKLDLSGGTMTGAFIESVTPLIDGSTPALDASLGNIFTLTTTTNPTIAVPSNPTTGQKIVIRVTASGGSRTVSLNTGAGGFNFGTDITSLSATSSGTTDYIGCIYNGSKWDVVAYIQGYA